MEESDLITKCLQQDRYSQRLLYERYSGQMYSICLRYCRDRDDACDALQNAFIRVFENLQSFKKESSLYSWIRTIVIRSALTELKKKRRIEEFFVNDEVATASIAVTEKENMTYEELIKVIHTMPLGYKTIFNLAVIDELSHSEISKLLGIKEATSRSQLLKARNFLKNILTTNHKLLI